VFEQKCASVAARELAAARYPPIGGSCSEEVLMSPFSELGDEAAVEECIQELEELVMGLDRYPPAAVAVAIATYLEGLLGALLDESQCTAEEVRELLRQIESGVIGSGTPEEARAPSPR
jgi:hypothetical protein